MKNDLISRQAAIDAMYRLEAEDIETYGCSIPEGFDAKPAVEALKALPSAYPERKWIPVTEALPEEEKDVLVSVHFDGHKSPTVDLPPSDYVEIASHVDGLWSSLSDEYKVAWKKHHVVAWMPLPEPMRGEE